MNNSKLDSQGGFTLIEILVAIVIGAIGLLGVARLQLVTMQHNSASQHRSVAIQLASDMLERMRANQDAVNAGDYNQAANTVTAAAYTTIVTNCQTMGACNASQRASTDLAEAMQQARLVLPGGAIIVCLDSGSGGNPTFDGTTINPACDGLGSSHAVKVFWLDDRSSQTSGLATGGFTAFVTRGTP